MSTQSTSTNIPQQLTLASSTPMQTLDLDFIHSFERMVMRFYEHQAEVLRVQEEYLKNQGETSQGFLRLMQQQYSAAVVAENGNGHSQEKLLPDSAAVITPKTPVITNKSDVEATPASAHQASSVNVSESVAVITNKSDVEATAETTSESVAQPVDVMSKSDVAALAQSLLAVVSDKTGYPTEMLELDMDMEADLGIDSIKRVEILGAMQDLYPDLPPLNPEELSEMRTLGEIVTYMGQVKTSGEKKTLVLA